MKSIAKDKVFDIPGSGMNSIECARIAPLFDVLLYAGEEKSRGEAEYLDHQEEMKRQRLQSKAKR